MHIIDEIVLQKQKELKRRRELYPTKLLEKSVHFAAPKVSLKSYLQRQDKVGIIAEIKRRSPSKGWINPHISVERLSIGYMQSGASALSILTDEPFFGGALDDLKVARRFNFCPILRKDFILDAYQIIEACSAGADVILLIARALTPEKTSELGRFAQQLGLEVLLEVHSRNELETHLNPHVDIVGVNNRNLEDFSVSIETSLDLVDAIPRELSKISESGLRDAQSIVTLKQAGYNGFLIGESFMRNSLPDKACARLVKEIQVLEAA